MSLIVQDSLLFVKVASYFFICIASSPYTAKTPANAQKQRPGNRPVQAGKIRYRLMRAHVRIKLKHFSQLKSIPRPGENFKTA